MKTKPKSQKQRPTPVFIYKRGKVVTIKFPNLGSRRKINSCLGVVRTVGDEGITADLFTKRGVATGNFHPAQFPIAGITENTIFRHVQQVIEPGKTTITLEVLRKSPPDMHLSPSAIARISRRLRALLGDMPFSEVYKRGYVLQFGDYVKGQGIRSQTLLN
jgi:hypothetical protein